jgi:PIN domain nuclease of toxin-antitoxin system
MIAYLDTNALVWLAQGGLDHFSSRVTRLLQQADLFFSPMVLLELEFLYEIKRVKMPACDIQRKVEYEMNLRLCTLPFPLIAQAALDEKWTRDPFDRMIVAHAKANGFASLITDDEAIRANYPRAVW